MNNGDMPVEKVWLAAHYHMPMVYSYRSPVSSPMAGVALPTPGPATVQLAMIRTGIDLFGSDYVKTKLFQHILACQPMIKPPDRVAISEQTLKLDKGDGYGIAYRQMIHAMGEMIVYVRVDADVISEIATLLRGIGYWGQTNSFAYCIDVCQQLPKVSDCIRPAEDIDSTDSCLPYFTGYVTELAGPSLSWTDVTEERKRSGAPIRQRLYVWPLVACEHRSTPQVFRHCALI